VKLFQQRQRARGSRLRRVKERDRLLRGHIASVVVPNRGRGFASRPSSSRRPQHLYGHRAIQRTYGSSPHKKKVWLALLERQAGAPDQSSSPARVIASARRLPDTVVLKNSREADSTTSFLDAN
jgi:hypothetical protein